MGNNEFEKLVIEVVRCYVNEQANSSDKVLTKDDVYIVWSCKTLQNNKALASTTRSDGMYYEITYNGDKDELYFDAYRKLENRCIKSPIERVMLLGGGVSAVATAKTKLEESAEPKLSVTECVTAGEKRNDPLGDTVSGMLSPDYKERFKAEYYQTKIRYTKLHNMLIKADAGTLEFTPTCPLDLLRDQKANMGKYLYCLEVRAQIEGVELN